VVSVARRFKSDRCLPKFRPRHSLRAGSTGLRSSLVNSSCLPVRPGSDSTAIFSMKCDILLFLNLFILGTKALCRRYQDSVRFEIVATAMCRYDGYVMHTVQKDGDPINVQTNVNVCRTLEGGLMEALISHVSRGNAMILYIRRPAHQHILDQDRPCLSTQVR